jgi:hypothetical protein
LQFMTRLIARLGVFGAAAVISLLAGCGGGGDSGGSGGGGGGGPSTNNTAPITVNAGVAHVANIPTVSVTVCAPGSTTNCQTVNNILIDTGSYGLRLVSGAVSQVLSSLPPSTIKGGDLIECAVFVSGFTWGSVRRADIHIAEETASNLPIQIMGDRRSVPLPLDCSGSAPQQYDTANDLGSNGILGIGMAPVDCPACANTAIPAAYYACSGSNCSATAVPLTQQVANPVPNFPVNNNGVILTLPAVSPDGAESMSGTLVFGIGTQANNTLNAPNKVVTDRFGNVRGTLNGAVIPTAFFDSGSNAYFFPTTASPALNECMGFASGFYCPPTTLTIPATVQSYGGGNVIPISMNIANASMLFLTRRFAFNNLGGPLPGMLDFGLPFFYGRRVYFGMDQTAAGGSAPYVAF